MKMNALKCSFLSLGVAALMLSCAGNTQQNPVLTVSGLDPAKFDTTIQDKPVKLFTLKNANGMEVCITNYGGRIVSLVVPDKDGKPTDVVLGFDNIAQYADTINTPSDYGSSVGRYANRIKEGKFTLNGEEIQLKKNDGPNCLHGGGNTGWMHQVYEAEQIGDSILKLTIVAADGENGFPGKIMAVTTYKLTADNVLDNRGDYLQWNSKLTKSRKKEKQGCITHMTITGFILLLSKQQLEKTTHVLYADVLCMLQQQKQENESSQGNQDMFIQIPHALRSKAKA